MQLTLLLFLFCLFNNVLIGRCALTDNIWVGYESGSVTINGRGEVNTLTIAKEQKFDLKFHTIRLDYGWPSPTATGGSFSVATAVASAKFGKTLGIEPVLVVDLWSKLQAVNPTTQNTYRQYISKVGDVIAGLSGRVWVVLEPTFNTASGLRYAGTFGAEMSTALATLRQRASGVSGLTLLVGQGATLRPTVREWANEFHNMRTTAFASLRQFDFFAPTITYVAGSTTQIAALSRWPCLLHITAQWVTDGFGLETFAPINNIAEPPVNFQWVSAYIAVMDDFRAKSKSLYRAGLRGIGFDEIVCGRGTLENGPCAIRATYEGAGIKDISLFIKAAAQKVRSFAGNEITQRRMSELLQPPPSFNCFHLLPIKSGTIYDDAFLQWESSFGWIDRSVSASIDPKSTTHIQDGEAAVQVALNPQGVFALDYVSPWPLSPILGSEFYYFVFDLFPLVAPTALDITIKVSRTGRSVPLKNYVDRFFTAGQWQRVKIPRIDLLDASAEASRVEFRAGSGAQTPFWLDRILLDAPRLPCRLAQPHEPCGAIISVPTPRPGPTPSGPAVCGNGVVEGDEECDGGLCCLPGTCKVRPAGTPCRAVVSVDPCDVADTCDGLSGGCRNEKKPVGSPCNDGDDRCTSNDRCRSNGRCAGDFTCNCVNNLACDTDTDKCTLDQCINGKCVSTPSVKGIPCDDFDECTSRDICNGNGVCEGNKDLCRKIGLKLPTPAPMPTPCVQPQGCTPGTQVCCRCEIPSNFCIAPLNCVSGYCLAPPTPVPARTPPPAVQCTLQDFGEKTGCPCQPGNWCNPAKALSCDAEFEVCLGEAPTPAAGTSTPSDGTAASPTLADTDDVPNAAPASNTTKTAAVSSAARILPLTLLLLPLQLLIIVK